MARNGDSDEIVTVEKMDSITIESEIHRRVILMLVGRNGKRNATRLIRHRTMEPF